MDAVLELLQNKILLISIFSWFVAQFIKLILTLIQCNKLDLSRMIGSGGMPSSHSSFVMSLSVSVGKDYGYDSASFAISLVLALIVMYDASGVRRAAGQQAAVINKIMEQLESSNIALDEKLKELLGHTPVEVLAGAFLGIIIALIL